MGTTAAEIRRDDARAAERAAAHAIAAAALRTGTTCPACSVQTAPGVPHYCLMEWRNR